MLGYGKDSKSYRIYNPHNRRITESRNVTFIETPHRSLKNADQDELYSNNGEEDEIDEDYRQDVLAHLPLLDAETDSTVKKKDEDKNELRPPYYEGSPSPAPSIESGGDVESPASPNSGGSPHDEFSQPDDNDSGGQEESYEQDEFWTSHSSWGTGLFALDPKKVPVCNGPPMELPLLDEHARTFQAKQRRFSPEETAMIQAEVQKMVDAGIIQRSTSPGAACLVPVRKKDGTVRICVDLRMLNERLVANSGDLGDITTIHSQMANSGCITSIDLASGFNQIDIAPADRPKTAFRDAHGELWEMLRPKFATKRARKHPIPWGPAQDEALSQLIHCLTSPPILALPNWKDPFAFHTDAPELGGGAALTQVQRGIERAISFASHRWSVSDAKWAPTEPVKDVFALASLPTAVVLSWWGGGHIIAAEGLLDVRAGVDEDWRAVECSRSNVSSNVRLVHTDLGGHRCEQIVRDAKPEGVLANVGKGTRESSVGAVLRTFAASAANLLVLECSAHPLTSSKGRELLPSLEKSYAMGAAELSALSVNVPTAKKRTFVTIVSRSKFPYVANKLLA
eukprot:g13876.t1